MGRQRGGQLSGALGPDAADIALLAGAGVLAGIVGAAGGITSLISYPALLATGLGQLAANVANIVALVACWPGSAATSRPELAGTAGWLWRWAPVAAAGGALGAGLLRVTPPGVFARVVPFLVLAASAGLVCQPALRRLHERRSASTRRLLLGGALPGVAVYNGYFGAGAGVMTLTLLMVAVDDRLASANARKNMLIGAATAASAVVLISTGRVHWGFVAPLAAGMLVGSGIGPLVARRVPPDVLRWVVALIGVGLAVELWVTS